MHSTTRCQREVDQGSQWVTPSPSPLAKRLKKYKYTQFCLNLGPRMSACIEEISTWMASNRLKLNPSKTDLIWLGSPRRLKHCPMEALSIAGVSINPSSHVRDLGVFVDGYLEAHISHICQTCFYHLRQLRVVRRSLTSDSAHPMQPFQLFPNLRFQQYG